MPKTSNTPNRTPSKPAKTHQVHKPKSQMRQRCFVSRQCSGGVPKMTNMRWMPAKIILNFPGRERCLQNDCWKDTSTRFNITQSYLVGKFNRNILRDEIYFQVTCCHFSGDSRHAVGLIFDIKLNLKWIQWLRLLETQILYKDVRVVVTWKKKVWHLNLDHYEQVSGSLDGKLIVWDSWTGNKIQVDSKFVVMCYRNGGLYASWHRWSLWSLRGWWPLPSRQAATWSRAGAWTTCSPCTTSTAGLASQSSHPVNWVQYKKQQNIFLFQKNRVTTILQNFSAGMPAEWRSLSER